MTKLIYIGEERWFPGWPAQDHDEEDTDLAKEKLASGLYRTETGKEIKSRQDALREAKNAANAKAAKNAEAHAQEVRRLAEQAEAEAAEARKTADELTAEASKAAQVAEASQATPKRAK